MTDDLLRAEARSILRTLTGRPDAEFHDGQFEAIAALVADRRRALVVQRTGWGKSAVYFIAALLRRRQGFGPALIVSPLLALMRDQVAAAARAGVRALTINSANVTEWSAVEADLAAGTVDVLLISPERLVNPRFRAEQLPRIAGSAGLVVVDEAHCISDWGHDFRPDYRRIRDLLADLPDDVPVLATTATANARVVADVEEQLAAGGHSVYTLRGPLARPSLRLGVLTIGSNSERLAWLGQHLGDFEGSGIVYCLTVAGAEDTAAYLARAGHAVRAYTGRTDDAERQAAEAALKANRVKALVATSALGMGFDKPDLGFVIHLGAPSSPVAYYQQVGRAGRATPNADVLLLPGTEDADLWHYFATNAMPTRERAGAVLTALAEAGGPLSVPALEARVDLRRSPLELLLKVLAVDGAVDRVEGGWVSTGRPWTYDQARYDRV
ncbi:MAG: RecQ family ATP-dependent DNA helicase, partial [Propionibacteriaceae bacterium]|nr:RecQ family ATP-dependent DNA helicase [Propionibacteriaceae bacterium]